MKNQHVTLFNSFAAIALSLLFSQSGFAAASENEQMVFEGNLTDTSGNAISLASVQLNFYITANGCYLYGESSTVSGDSQGNIIHRFGSGTIAAGSPNTFSQNLFFGNVTGTTTFAGNNCSVTAADTRLAQVYYPAQNITATIKLGTVPYAQNATTLSGKAVTDFVQTSVDTVTLFTGGSAGQILTKSASGLTWTTSNITAAQVTSALGYTPSSATLTASAINTALGYTPASNTALAAYAQKANNLSDLSSSATARTNLGLGALATKNSVNLATAEVTGTLPATNLPGYSGDVVIAAGSSTATVQSLRGVALSATAPASGQVLVYNGSAWTPITPPNPGIGTVTNITAGTGLTGGSITSAGTLSVNFGTSAGTVMQGNDSRITGALQAANNLSDLVSATLARNNLGLGSLATKNLVTLTTEVSGTLAISNGGTGSTTAAGARTNLGLGSFATANTIDLGSASATGTLATARLPAFAGDVASTAGSATITVTKLRGINISVSAPTTSQVLAFDGTQWSPTNMAPGGITSIFTGTGLLGGPITSSGTISINFGASAGTVAAGNDSRIVQALQSVNNLSDLGSSATARANLGLGSLATKSTALLNTADVSGVLPVANGGSKWTQGGGGIYSTSNVGINGVNPTARLHIASGTTSVAPLKFTTGSLMAMPASGAIEYDGSRLYITDNAGTRQSIVTGIGSTAIDNINNINSTANISLNPIGSVVVSSTVASTNPQTGALIVKGGVGVNGNGYFSGVIAASGSIVTSANIYGSAVVTPSIFGGGNASDSLIFDSTTHGTKGNIILAPNGGFVGIGTTTPRENLQVIGDLEISAAASGAKSYRFRTAGSALDLEAAGGDLWTSVWSGTDYSGIQQFYDRYKASTHMVDSVGVRNFKSGSIPSAGTSLLYIDGPNTGNIGIGTTAPTARLHIAAGSNSLAPLKLTSGPLVTSATAGAIEFDGNRMYLTNGANYRQTIPMGNNASSIDNITHYNSTADINLIPGAGTTRLSGRLEVNANSSGEIARFNTSGTNQVMSFAKNTVDVGSIGWGTPGFMFTNAISDALAIRGQTGVQFGAGTSAAVTITPSGNMGIGTTTPGNPFVVETDGGVAAAVFHRKIPNNSAITGFELHRSRSDAVAPGAGFGVDFEFTLEGFTDNSRAVAANIVTGWESAQVNDTTSRNSFMSLATANNNVINERMRIDSSGRVSIGTASGTAKLTVSGTIRSTAGGYEFPDGSAQPTSAFGGYERLSVSCGAASSCMATCSAGKKILGGGCTNSASPSTAAKIISNFPASDTQWQCTWEASGAYSGITAWAICTKM